MIGQSCLIFSDSGLRLYFPKDITDAENQKAQILKKAEKDIADMVVDATVTEQQGETRDSAGSGVRVLVVCARCTGKRAFRPEPCCTEHIAYDSSDNHTNELEPRLVEMIDNGVPRPVVNNTMWHPHEARAVAATRSFPGAESRFRPFTFRRSP